MDHFDSQVKNHLKNHLDKNVYFSIDNKEKVTQSLLKKRRHPFIITGLTTFIFSLVLILAISFPFWIQPENNIILEQSASPFSELNISVKEIIPEGFFKQKEQESEKINTIENNKNDSDHNVSKHNENTSIEDNKDSKAEDSNNQFNQNETVDEETFIQLVKKYNNMGNYLTENMTFEESLTPEDGPDSITSFESKTFSSKKEYYDYLSTFMTYDLAKDLWDYRLVEYNNKLGVIPMDGHISFLLDQPYTIERLSDTEYFINQEHSSDLYGVINLTIYFTFQENQWLISKIDKG
ncbi:hypothetical protein [Gracilibacillus saliphilus]|uniref:hypothetical protein n=1 Tax=Gracilibacillus saliphilus TaxID=543890 RepID=UPI0013D1D149|nr:hypothetical protein [Gracilibacillus saliphilus]